MVFRGVGGGGHVLQTLFSKPCTLGKDVAPSVSVSVSVLLRVKQQLRLVSFPPKCSSVAWVSTVSLCEALLDAWQRCGTKSSCQWGTRWAMSCTWSCWALSSLQNLSKGQLQNGCIIYRTLASEAHNWVNCDEWTVFGRSLGWIFFAFLIPVQKISKQTNKTKAKNASNCHFCAGIENDST